MKTIKELKVDMKKAENLKKKSKMEKKQIPNRLNYPNDNYYVKTEDIIGKVNEIIEYLENGN